VVLVDGIVDQFSSGPSVRQVNLMRPRLRFVLLAVATGGAAVVLLVSGLIDGQLGGGSFMLTLLLVAFCAAAALRASSAAFYADAEGVHYRSWPSVVQVITWDQIADVRLARRVQWFSKQRIYSFGPELKLTGGDTFTPFWGSEVDAQEAVASIASLLFVERQISDRPGGLKGVRS
jgi:hypothetical protein